MFKHLFNTFLYFPASINLIIHQPKNPLLFLVFNFYIIYLSISAPLASDLEWKHMLNQAQTKNPFTIQILITFMVLTHLLS